MKRIGISIILTFAVLAVLLVGTYYLIRSKAMTLPGNNPSICKELGPGKKRLLLVGDSITHGSVSYNFADELARRLGKDVQVINGGINSNLTINVLRRMPDLVACNPDLVAILIGTNDVNSTLHPKFLERYRKTMEIEGTPDENEYQRNLLKIVESFQSLNSKPKIAVLSLPVIGEDLNSPANQRVREYSKIIGKISQKTNTTYLPLNETQRDYLEDKSTADSQCDRPHLRMEISVAKHYLLGMDYDSISKSNGFYLVTDCLHLNETAGKMVADLIQGFVEK